MPKNADPRIIAVIVIKFEQGDSTIEKQVQKMQFNGVANSVDPGQRSSLIWVYTVCLGLLVQKLGINTVFCYSIIFFI